MPVRHDHWIAGGSSAPASGRYLATTDPTTREGTDEVAAGTAEDVELAVSAAAEAVHEWRRWSAADRAAVLLRVAEAIEASDKELMEIERTCTGKTAPQLRLEIEMSADYFRYYAGLARSVAGRTIDAGGDSHVFTRLEPYGVVGVITPWNLPLNQACRAVAPALAVGNAVIAKPSEFTSLSTLRLAQLASEVGLPAGVLNVVTGTGPDVGEPLATNAGVRRIAFTGSPSTGRALAALAGQRVVPITLELGGKSPQIVFADADLDRAVSAAVRSIATNSGQVCSATTRLLVARGWHDEMVGRVSEAVGELQPGVDFGPMITEAQFEKVLSHFDDATNEGLSPVVGGGPYTEGPAARGWFVRPTVYAGVPPTARIAREEVFGPVLVTMPFEDEEDAVSKANDTEYGLVATVWTGDVRRGLRVAQQLEAGQVAVNGGPLTVETPFGGFKGSGFGREKGIEALHEYVQIKTVSLGLS